jgi:hypothetical protein
VLTGFAAAASTVPDDSAVDPGAVLLDDPGGGLVRQGPDTSGAQGTTTRTFRRPDAGATLQLTIVPISGGVDVRQLFGLFAGVNLGLQPVDVPGLALARWYVTPGRQADDAPAALVVFASRHAVFSALLVTDGASGAPAVPVLLELARRQIDRAGGPPRARQGAPVTGQDQLDLTRLLPARPATRFGPAQAATATGTDELPKGVDLTNQVTRFLHDHAHTAVRAYALGDGVTAAVGITRFPYDIFAGAALQSTRDDGDLRATGLEASTGVGDAFTFAGTGREADQVGVAFRRGPLSVTVLALGPPDADRRETTALANDLARQTARAVPSGASAPYRFPSPPSTILAVLLSSLFVTGAGLSSIGVGRARAWTLRRSEQGSRAKDDGTPGAPGTGASTWPAPGEGAVLPLDEDARQLRRRGYVVLAVQLLAANVIIVALAGDFGSTGVAVAVVGLAGGLAFTSWWRQRELATIGPEAPRRHLVLPRAGGLVLGVIAIAVLVLGVSYTLKGLRYLVLKPTLAQLKWSDRLGLTPRGVGVAFAIGGVAVAALGGILFRTARALGRATTHRLLEIDRRPPVLYLRSFGDDSLPVATIPSARRPFFELFSYRGRDPFEEAVAWELASYGPVVAVGRPGHGLESLGAAREHLSADTWKEQVAARMTGARVVVVATGETEGLRWELQQLVTAGHLAKTIFVFPPTPGDALARRWAYTASALRLAGAPTEALPCPADLVHTAQVGADGTVVVTTATRRDEASYRTAVDRAMAARAPESQAPSAPVSR